MKIRNLFLQILGVALFVFGATGCPAQTTTTLTGSITDGSGTALANGDIVFQLANCGGNPTVGNSYYHFILSPTGGVSGTIEPNSLNGCSGNASYYVTTTHSSNGLLVWKRLFIAPPGNWAVGTAQPLTVVPSSVTSLPNYPVNSVFNRQGDIVAVNGDYTAQQIGGLIDNTSHQISLGLLPYASATGDGILSSSDWSKFNTGTDPNLHLQSLFFGGLKINQTASNTITLSDTINGGDATLNVDGLQSTGDIAIGTPSEYAHLNLQNMAIGPAAYSLANSLGPNTFVINNKSNNSVYASFGPTSISFPAAFKTAGCVTTDSTGLLSVASCAASPGNPLNLPAQNNVLANSNGSVAQLPELGTSTANGVTTVAWKEDYDNGIFDCRNPKYGPGGCKGANPAQAMQDLSDAMTCYASITGKHPTTYFPAGSFTVGLSTREGGMLKFPAGGNYYGAGASRNGHGTIFQGTYNNSAVVGWVVGLKATCSDGLVHTSNISGGEVRGIGEHGCAQGGCIAFPGDTRDYGNYGPGQGGMFLGDSQGNFSYLSADSNGSTGINFNGQDSTAHHLWLNRNLQWWIYGANAAPTIFAPTSTTLTPSTTGGTLAAGTYYYKVTTEADAYAGGTGESLPGTEVSTTTTGSTGSVTVSWPAVTGASGYKIYRGSAAGAEGAYFNTILPAPSLTGSVATTGGTLHNGMFYYKVTAVNSAGETVGSNEVLLTTNNTTSVNNLSWSPVTGATSYKLYRGYPSNGESQSNTTTGTTFADTSDSLWTNSTSVPTTNTTGLVTSIVDKGAGFVGGAVPTKNTTHYNPAGDGLHGQFEAFDFDGQAEYIETYGTFDHFGAEYGHTAGLLLFGGTASYSHIFSQLDEIGINIPSGDGIRLDHFRIDASKGSSLVNSANDIVTNGAITAPCQDASPTVASVNNGVCVGVESGALGAKYSNISHFGPSNIFNPEQSTGFVYGAGQIGVGVDGPIQQQNRYAANPFDTFSFLQSFAGEMGPDVKGPKPDLTLLNGIHPSDTTPTNYTSSVNGMYGQGFYVKADNPNATFIGPAHGGHWHNCNGGDLNLNLGGIFLHYTVMGGIYGNPEIYEQCDGGGSTSGSMVYPGAGVAVSTGTAWGTSLPAPTSGLVGLTDTQTITNKTVDGVTPATFGFLDATSSIQTQIDAKQAAFASQTANYVFAAPNGAAGVPAFRALVAADIPSLPQYQGALTLTTTGSSGAATLTGNTLNIPQYSSAGMVYPGAGIANSTGTAWGTSFAAPVGVIVGTTDTQTLTNKTLDGVTPATFGFLDATSSIQNQLNGKQGTLSITTNGTSGAATLSGNVLNIPQYAGSPMVYPGSGIPNSTGSAWGTSYSTSGTGSVVPLTNGPTFTGNTSVGSLAINALGTATSGSGNYNSNSLSLYANYWNGSAAASLAWAINHVVSSGITPNTVLLSVAPPLSGLGSAVAYDRHATGDTATASANFNSPTYQLQGTYWDGAASQLDKWSMVNSLGTGANPTSTLAFTHAGSSGNATISIPSLTIGSTGGTQLLLDRSASSNANFLQFTTAGSASSGWQLGMTATTTYFRIVDAVNSVNAMQLTAGAGTNGTATFAGNVNAARYQTAGNCSSSASPAVCAGNSAGSVVVAAGATSVVVNETSVTANSQILITPDASLGTKLGVTCNTTFAALPAMVTARTAGTSFTISVNAAPTTNPQCFSYQVIN